MLSHLQIVHVPVSDQQVARDFYVDVLGLEVLADVAMGPHGRWLQVAPHGATTTIALVPGDADGAGGAGGLVLESTDIDDDVAALTERGVAFEAGIEDLPWGRAARFSDPDGNPLVLQTALSQEPPGAS